MIESLLASEQLSSHKAFTLAKNNNGRARQRNKPGLITWGDILWLYYDVQNTHCALCGEPMKGIDVSIDHTTPLKHGGKNTRDNINLMHRKCNGVKGLHPINIAKNRLANLQKEGVL